MCKQILCKTLSFSIPARHNIYRQKTHHCILVYIIICHTYTYTHIHYNKGTNASLKNSTRAILYICLIFPTETMLAWHAHQHFEVILPTSGRTVFKYVSVIHRFHIRIQHWDARVGKQAARVKEDKAELGQKSCWTDCWRRKQWEIFQVIEILIFVRGPIPSQIFSLARGAWNEQNGIRDQV